MSSNEPTGVASGSINNSHDGGGAEQSQQSLVAQHHDEEVHGDASHSNDSQPHQWSDEKSGCVSHGCVTQRKFVLGILVLLAVVILWVLSAELTKFIFTREHFTKPFFVTYLKSSLFSLYLLGFLCSPAWRQLADIKKLAKKLIKQDEQQQKQQEQEFLTSRRGAANQKRRRESSASCDSLLDSANAASGSACDGNLLEPHFDHDTSLPIHSFMSESSYEPVQFSSPPAFSSARNHHQFHPNHLRRVASSRQKMLGSHSGRLIPHHTRLSSDVLHHHRHVTTPPAASSNPVSHNNNEQQRRRNTRSSQSSCSNCVTEEKAVRFCKFSEVRHLSAELADESTFARLSYSASRSALRRMHTRVVRSHGILPLHPDVLLVSLCFCALWFLASYAYQVALQFATPALVNALSASSALFLLLLMVAFPPSASQRNDAFNSTKLCLVLLNMAGVCLVSFYSQPFSSHSPSSRNSSVTSVSSTSMSSTSSSSTSSSPIGGAGVWQQWAGVGFSLAGALGYSLYLLLLRKRVPSASSVPFPMFLGFVGAWNVALLWPGFFLLHALRFELFCWPSPSQLVYILLNGVFGSIFPELLWLWGCYYTSSLLGTLALSLTLPFTIIADLFIDFQLYDFKFYVGCAMIFVGFIGTALIMEEDSEKTLKELQNQGEQQETKQDEEDEFDEIIIEEEEEEEAEEQENQHDVQEEEIRERRQDGGKQDHLAEFAAGEAKARNAGGWKAWRWDPVGHCVALLYRKLRRALSSSQPERSGYSRVSQSSNYLQSAPVSS